MDRTERLYRMAEALLGRALLWRLGRLLYMGARRELRNEPETNGEYALQQWFLKTAEPNAPLTICDVGANVGNWTEQMRAALRLADHQTFVIRAFEPADAQFNQCRVRFAGDMASGKICLDARGVGAETGTVRFQVTGSDTGNSAIVSGCNSANGAGIVDIPVVALDDLAAECGYARLDLVKVDTEGNDFNVIKGARHLFEAGAIGILQFEYNWRWVAFGHTLYDVYGFLEGTPYRIGKLTADGIEFYARWHQELERFFETNYVIARADLAGRLPHQSLVFDGGNTPVPA